MNKAALKSFAIEARNDLIDKVKLRAKRFGMDAKKNVQFQITGENLVVNGTQYDLSMHHAFESLQKRCEQKGYEQLIEETAYTWFNRIIAIRFMEVNQYLPNRVNVLSSSSNGREPDILLEYATMELPIDPFEIQKLIDQDQEQAYRKLFIAQCNELNKILPFMFETIHDYTELLLPDYLLDPESVINNLVHNVDLTESFADVEVIGWLYQFYNSELKDQLFDSLENRKKKFGKYDIAPATQLFTPKWIVQYLVENSLGQLWLDYHSDSEMKQQMRYYVEPAAQQESVKNKLEDLRGEYSLEELKFLDPCCGSGHVLVYAFDLLYDMYRELGYLKNDIPALILEKNLYGIDIDDRAAQLTCFSLMMKARKISRTILRQGIVPNVVAIQETNQISTQLIADLLFPDHVDLNKQVVELVNTYRDSKYYGSLLVPSAVDTKKILSQIGKVRASHQFSAFTYESFQWLDDLEVIIKQHLLLTGKYDVVVTNPPYMGSRGMDSNITLFLSKKYEKSKSDLFSAFIERCICFTKEKGLVAMVTMQSWMFLTDFEKFRKNLLGKITINNINHLGMEAFEAIVGKVVSTVAFSLRNVYIPDSSFKGIRLVDFYDSLRWMKEEQFFNDENHFVCKQDRLHDISGSPVAYWASDRTRQIFKESPALEEFVDLTGSQHKTANNNKFLRYHWEIRDADLGTRWISYAKGGNFRKWYGNNELVVDWGDEALHFYKTNKTSNLIKEQYWFRKGITWTASTNSDFSCRVLEPTGVFDVKGASLFLNNETDFYYVISYLNSSSVNYFLKLFSETNDYQNIDIKRLPFVDVAVDCKQKINELVKLNITICKSDWDNSETSPYFEKHPLLKHENAEGLISTSFYLYNDSQERQFEIVRNNEVELNRIFIELFGLNDELDGLVQAKQVSVKKAERKHDSKTFLSYFIGCLTGRYSLDIQGLAYAGGVWDESKYERFKPLQHGIVLFTDANYFQDDIITRLREFLSVIYGNDTVVENLEWIADSLERKKNESSEARIRRYFMDEFFKDHIQVYQKRPIYWLVDSGKQAGLRSLLYLHRYQNDTIAAIRFKHLKEIQAKYYNEIEAINIRLANPDLAAKEKRDLEKEREKFNKRIEELTEFDKKLATYANDPVEIDLDDGVKLNYVKFTDNDHPILAKI